MPRLILSPKLLPLIVEVLVQQNMVFTCDLTITETGKTLGMLHTGVERFHSFRKLVDKMITVAYCYLNFDFLPEFHLTSVRWKWLSYTTLLLGSG